jgi:hypothetical protein
MNVNGRSINVNVNVVKLCQGKYFEEVLSKKKNNNVGVPNSGKLPMEVISKTYGQRIGRIFLTNYCYSRRNTVG